MPAVSALLAPRPAGLEVALAPRLKKVFLSSTARDLAEYRDAVAAAINRLDGWKCIRMEDFGARATTPDAFCRGMVPQCDLFVGLIGHFYGSIPKGKTRSYTEREFDAARKAGMPRLMLFADEGFLLPREHWKEAVASEANVQRFRERAKMECLGDFFSFGSGAPQNLAMKVATAISNHAPSTARPARKAARGASSRALSIAAIERQYLAFVFDRYQNLEFKGMGVSDRFPVQFPLLEMYVPLKARLSLPEGETWSEELRLAGRRLTEEDQREIGKVGQPQPVLELLQKEAGLILLGDPGAGKSTFLKMLAVSLAGGRSTELGLGDRVPFLIPIAAYAEELSKKPLRLDQFIDPYLREQVDDLPFQSLLWEALAKGRALLLLDGLDEVRERGLQTQVVARFQNFYTRHKKAGNKFVLTSRIVGYREVRPTCAGLTEATLVDFSEGEIGEYLSRWVVLLEKSARGDSSSAERSAEKEKEELLKAVRHNPAVRALAANPLLLTILTLMKRQGVTLPEQRAKLYNAYIKTLLETWNAARSLAEKPKAEKSAGDLLRTLAPLALWIHETSPGVGLVRQSELRRRLEEIYRERGEADAERAAQEFLRDIEKSSLLLERGNDRYGFIHLTFLEYLAGYALAKLDQQGPEAVYEAVAEHVGEPTWREVLLLAIGHLGVVDEREITAGNVLVALVEKTPGRPGEAVVLAGTALADLGEKGVLPEVRAKVVSALLGTMRDTGIVKAVQRVQAGEALAVLGDPRPEAMTVEGMQFCWVPPGPFLMGSADNDPDAADFEKPQDHFDLPQGFWIGRYPVTVAQYREYWEAAKRSPDEAWMLVRPPTTPVICISWYHARSFCGWLTRVAKTRGWLPEGLVVDLPSEAEWEKAARGGLELPRSVRPLAWGELNRRDLCEVPNLWSARRFPWGQASEPDKANCRDLILDRPSPVGCFAEGTSPLGCEEMSGNLWEWTRSLWRRYHEDPKASRPYRSSAGLEIPEDFGGMLRVLRGGSYLINSRYCRCAVRVWSKPHNRDDSSFGFRVVLRPFFPDS